MSPTIQDIADAANVSKATVSYVINDKPGVGEDTRQRILDIMREMKYRPNPQARGLAARRTEMLGLMIPDITDPFYVNIVRGVEAKANELGYTLNLCTTHGVEERELNVAEFFVSGRVDGVIMMPYRLSDDDVEDIADRGVPLVVVDNPADDSCIPSVVVDNVSLGRLATSYLISLGHRRIGFVHGADGSITSERRYRGYLEALSAAGIEPAPELCARGGFLRDGGYHAALQLLSADAPAALASDRPTAVFAANDQMALGVLAAAVEVGLSVPGDLSVIGVDDIEAASLVTPSLTTLRQPTYEMGTRAAEMLVELIGGQGSSEEPQHVPCETFEATLITRESCAALVR